MKGYSAFLITISLLVLLFIPLGSTQADSGATLYGVVQVSTLMSYPVDEGANFGHAIAVSGSYAVIGAPYSNIGVDSKGLYGSGAAYVFTLGGGGAWQQEQMVMPNDPKISDLYGYSVDIDGDTLVIGAPGRDFDDDTVGVVYVFVRTGDGWEQQARLEPAYGDDGDAFGTSVSLIGDRLMVGAPGATVGTSNKVGAVYEFIRSGGKWYEKVPITADDASPNSLFGTSVQMDGLHMIIGAPESGTAGNAYIFYRTGGNWKQQAKLEPKDGQSGDYFGASVAVSGGTVMVGAPLADPNLGMGQVTNAGAVYQFKSRGGDWTQQAKVTADGGQAFDHFGTSLAVNDQFLVVGANDVDDYTIMRAGEAYLYMYGLDSWELQTRIVPTLSTSDGSFGAAVALNGDKVLIGEPGPLQQGGSTYYFSIAQGYLPNTGFTPGVFTNLPEGISANYEADNGLSLSIPALGVTSEIVGVPRQDNDWDVRWLGNDLGYLDGTAYPGTLGNTILAGHVYSSDGYPGPFIDLKSLNWGDELILNIYGEEFTYQVRQTFETGPDDMSVLADENDYFWLTLVTCSDYNENTDQYQSRYVVKAIRLE